MTDTTGISEMQERVTKAILPAFEHIQDKDYRLIIAGCWARAAIEAMREPTKEMLREAWADALAEDAAGVWRSMVDAALTHGEKVKPHSEA